MTRPPLVLRNRRLIGTGLFLGIVIIIVVGVTLVIASGNSGKSPPESDLPAVPEDTIAPISSPLREFYQLQEQAALVGWTPESHWQAGELLMRLGDQTRAVAHWYASAPETPGRLERLADAYVTLQDWSAIKRVLTDLLDLQPDHRWANYQMGLLSAATDPMAAVNYLTVAAASPSYEHVAQMLQTVILEDPANPRLAMRVGLVLAQIELWPYAEIAFRQAAQLNVPYPEALAYTGIARQMQGKNGQSWMDEALELAPYNAQVQYLHGLYLRARQNYQDSWQAFVYATMRDPQNPAYYAELGIANKLLFDYAQAEHWLKMAVEVSGNAAEFQQILATFYAEDGYNLTEESLASLQQARDNVPADPDLLAGFGWARYALGDTTGALLDIDAALAIAEQNADALYYKARILVETGQTADAMPYLRRLSVSNSAYVEWAEETIAFLEAAEATTEPQPLPEVETTAEATPEVE